jgi:trehalose 6-phosphate synthase/phosphatase
LEMRPSTVDKTNAAKAILQDLEFDVDFLVCIGDGKHDENLFINLGLDWQYTVTVGKKRTEAKYFVDGLKDVEDFLNSFITPS